MWWNWRLRIKSIWLVSCPVHLRFCISLNKLLLFEPETFILLVFASLQTFLLKISLLLSCKYNKTSIYNGLFEFLCWNSICSLFKHLLFTTLQISEDFDEVTVQSRGFGILDVGYRSLVLYIMYKLLSFVHIPIYDVHGISIFQCSYASVPLSNFLVDMRSYGSFYSLGNLSCSTFTKGTSWFKKQGFENNTVLDKILLCLR